MDKLERNVLDNIAKFGCDVMMVHDENGELPPFAYSVGIQKSLRAPEAFVIGLDQAIAHWMINEYMARVRKGEHFVPGQRYSGFLEGFDVELVAVERRHYEEYFGWNRWLYKGDEFSVIQLVFPSSASGLWPWDDGATDEFRSLQPVLSERGAG